MGWTVEDGKKQRMIIISKPKGISLAVLSLLIYTAFLPFGHAYTYSGTNLPANTIYFDDFGNYVTPSPCTTAALACLPGWGAYDNATGGVANITTWHPLSSSGKSMYMASATGNNAKFDRHRSFAVSAGSTRLSASQWFQFDQAAKGAQSSVINEIHFSLESVGVWPDNNFHECVMEYFPMTPYNDEYVGLNDRVFNYNISLNAFDRGNFNTNPNAIFDNNQWHYEKITMDISNPAAPTCPYFQLDNLVVSNNPSNLGWTTSYSNKVSFKGTGDTATTHTLLGTYQYQIWSTPWRLEIAMITSTGGSPSTYHSWHTNILITDDTPGNPNIIQFALRGAAWGLASMFSVIALVIGFIWIKMDLEGKGYTHGGLDYKKKILRGGIMIALAIAIIWGATAVFTG